MSLISKQSCNPSKYSPNHSRYSVSEDKFDDESTISSHNYPSYEKSYYRQPKFFNCPLVNQSESESDENYFNDVTVKKNLSTIISQCEHCPLSSVTSSERELNENLYRPLPINNDDLYISNLSSDSDDEKSSDTYLKFNRTMNETLPNILSNKYDERSRCRVKNNRAHSLPMTFQRELTPTSLRIGTQPLYNNFQCDFHQDEEIKNEENGINSHPQKLHYDKSIDCDLQFKTSMTNLVNSKSEAFINVKHQTFGHSIAGETSSSLTILNKLPGVVTKKNQNRFPYTICDNNKKQLEIFHHNCVSDVNAINTNKNTDESEIIDINKLAENINDKYDELNLPEKKKLFRSWMKSITRIFSSPIKKKNCTKQNLNIEVLFENNECPYSSSEIDMNKQKNCCNCNGKKMEFRLKERFRRLNRDDLWIQDIVPVNYSDDTDSRYSLFLVKNARDKITTTNNSEIHPPSAEQCAKCQCQLVTSSLATDITCQQPIINSTNVEKQPRTDCRIKLSQQCFCFRIWHLFSHKSNESITKKAEI